MIAHLREALSVVIAIILLFTLPALSDEKKTLTFTLTVRGELNDTAATKAGFRTILFDYAHLSFTKYDVSDGEKVFLSHAEFRSAGEAKRYFDWMLKRQVAQDIKHGDKIDRDGKTVGHRAEFALKSDGVDEEWIIIWTQGVHVVLVSSPTRECTLEFERQATESEAPR